MVERLADHATTVHTGVCDEYNPILDQDAVSPGFICQLVLAIESSLSQLLIGHLSGSHARRTKSVSLHSLFSKRHCWKVAPQVETAADCLEAVLRIAISDVVDREREPCHPAQDGRVLRDGYSSMMSIG